MKILEVCMCDCFVPTFIWLQLSLRGCVCATVIVRYCFANKEVEHLNTVVGGWVGGCVGGWEGCNSN